MADTVPLTRRLVAEALGTALLVILGTGCVMTEQITQGALGLTGIALTWGFLVTALVGTLGAISGCHINPAVTVALTAAGRHPAREVAPYVAAQCIGATTGSLVLLATLGNVSSMGATIPTVSVGTALAIEFWLSFVLMATVLGASADERWGGGGAAIAIGMAVALDVLMGGPLTGASMNPARSLGPALVGGRWDSHWVYWAAPIGGMLAAALTMRWLRGK